MTPPVSTAPAAPRPGAPQKPRSLWPLWILLFVTAAPIVAAFFYFYVVHPSGKPPYGSLIEPQRPIPADLKLTTLDGKPYNLHRLEGYWLMAMAAPAACDEQCQQLLFYLRQIRITMNTDRNKVVRVWFITDDAPVNPGVMQPAEGTLMLRANPQQLAKWLPSADGRLDGPVWLIDPFGHLMLQFPSNPDPTKMRRVLARLLYNNAGIRFKHVEPVTQ